MLKKQTAKGPWLVTPSASTPLPKTSAERFWFPVTSPCSEAAFLFWFSSPYSSKHF